MKTINFLQIIALCLTLSSCDSCEEKEWDTLPPETQTGANTFGCYVNGELFVNGKIHFSIFPVPAILIAEYFVESERLIIHCTSKDAHFIDLIVDNPKEKENKSFSYCVYVPTGARNCIGFACENGGMVFITKLDTINHIVSGNFVFSGRCSSLLNDESGKLIFTGDSIVNITNGRFDLKLNTYDNNN